MFVSVELSRFRVVGLAILGVLCVCVCERLWVSNRGKSSKLSLEHLCSGWLRWVYSDLGCGGQLLRILGLSYSQSQGHVS